MRLRDGLGGAPSTISRELRRNAYNAYLPARVQGVDRAMARRAACPTSEDGQAPRPTTGCASTYRTSSPVWFMVLMARSWLGRLARRGRDATSLTAVIGRG